MINVLTIDLEEWFCTFNMRSMISFGEWENLEPRIFENTLKLLDLFDKKNIKATFFVLGWIAQKYPDLIKEIEKKGHEIAIHGYNHQPVFEMTQDQFRYDLERTLNIMSSVSSYKITGYRAPMFSVGKNNTWVFDTLTEFGIKYDSSIFPVSYHPDYGMKHNNLSIYRHSESLIEVPISCVKIFNQTIPCGGGGYFRLYPYFLFKKLVGICNSQGRPLVFYLHPWEIDSGQPVIDIPRLRKFRHYNNLDKTYLRLEKLLDDFHFTSINEILKNQINFV